MIKTQEKREGDMKSLKGKLTLVITCVICIVCLVITAAISYRIASSQMSEKDAIGVVIILLVTRKVVEPLGKLEHTVTSRDVSENIQVHTRDEVGRLAKGLNRILPAIL